MFTVSQTEGNVTYIELIGLVFPLGDIGRYIQLARDSSACLIVALLISKIRKQLIYHLNLFCSAEKMLGNREMFGNRTEWKNIQPFPQQ